jgi:hypothetical protein
LPSRRRRGWMARGMSGKTGAHGPRINEIQAARLPDNPGASIREAFLLSGHSGVILSW